MDQCKVLYEGQYGYRRGRSTTDTILDFTGNIIENLNKGNYTLGIFLDLSKAFDSINHTILFKKLEHYGIRGTVLEWLKSYFMRRSIVVDYKDIVSERHLLSYGTPQGLVLGPLLFLVFANDLVKSLKFGNCVTFADDTTIFMSGNNLSFLYKKANEDLRRLSSWLDSNFLTLNIEKSLYVLFRTKNKALDDSIKLKIGDREIKRAKNTKFLGVIIDEYLDWEAHVNRTLSKLSTGNYSLCMVSKCLPFNPKRRIYFTNVESHFKYALSVWGPMLKMKQLKKLKKAANKSIRTLCNAKTRVRLSHYYNKARIQELEKLIEIELLKISFRYVNDLLPARICNLFEMASHDHYTRNRNSLRSSIHTSNKYNQSFLGKSPSLWLSISNSKINSKSMKEFLKNVVNWKVMCTVY